jgi:hypothetical protein
VVNPDTLECVKAATASSTPEFKGRHGNMFIKTSVGIIHFNLFHLGLSLGIVIVIGIYGPSHSVSKT